MSAPATMPLSPASGALNPADFARLAERMGQETGIRLPPGKRTMVEARLRKRLRALRREDLDAYCRDLLSGVLREEWPHVVDALTTNKTDFFREPAHFALLEQEIVPHLITHRQGDRRRLKLWSAAASNGAEAWTLAMVMERMVDRRPTLDYAILGTDISSEVLAQARRAVYPSEAAAQVPKAYQARLLRGRGADRASQVRIAPELRRRVRFARLNLMDTTYPVDRDVDAIFLRNVLIYFDQTDQAAVIDRMVGHLRLGGCLLLGHSEAMVGDRRGLRQIAPAVFRKV